MIPSDQPVRSRILYVDRDNPGGDHRCRIQILEELKKDYDVDAVINLTPEVVGRVRHAESTRPYEAIITHVPPGCIGPGCSLYGDSLDIIADIVRSTEATVIAFTGAYGFYQLLDYADVVVEKSTIENDLRALREALARSVGRRARVRPPEPPNPVRRDDYVFVEATVNLRKGINGLIAVTIARECKKFAGEVTFRNLSDEGADCIVSGKSIMGLMMLAAGEGTQIEISVVGTGAGAETLARRMYGIVTSRSYFDLNPKRFVAP